MEAIYQLNLKDLIAICGCIYGGMKFVEWAWRKISNTAVDEAMIKRDIKELKQKVEGLENTMREFSVEVLRAIKDK